jgi:hypothetical protein
MFVSQNPLTPVPLKLPPPRFSGDRHPSKRRNGNSQSFYRVVRYSSDHERVRVFCNAQGINELDEFLNLYPHIDAWRAGSTFSVEVFSWGGWRKLDSHP